MSIHLLTLQCSGSLSPSPRASRQLINNVPPLFGYSATKQLSGERVCREWKLGCWVLGRAQHRGCQCKERNLPGTAAAPFVCPPALFKPQLGWGGPVHAQWLREQSRLLDSSHAAAPSPPNLAVVAGRELGALPLVRDVQQSFLRRVRRVSTAHKYRRAAPRWILPSNKPPCL